MQSYNKIPNYKETIMKRQWAKYVSKGIAKSLMHYNPDSKLYKSYKNSTFCVETMTTNEVGKISTSYCKNRWCGVCNRIKTGRLINNYLPQLQQLFQPVFVTLTLPTCKGDELPQRIEQMEKTWRNIYKNTKKAKYQKNNTPFKGIRKAETTIRPNGLYHYHFHFILNDWHQGEWLIKEWQRHYPEANRKAQDIRFANEFAFRELFKYAFKAEVKTSNKNAKRFDLVFNALRKKRTYQSFGLKAIDEEFKDEDLKNNIILEGFANDIFKWSTDDWYSTLSGLALVDKPIPQKVKNLVNYPDNI